MSWICAVPASTAFPRTLRNPQHVSGAHGLWVLAPVSIVASCNNSSAIHPFPVHCVLRADGGALRKSSSPSSPSRTSSPHYPCETISIVAKSSPASVTSVSYHTSLIGGICLLHCPHPDASQCLSHNTLPPWLPPSRADTILLTFLSSCCRDPQHPFWGNTDQNIFLVSFGIPLKFL